MAPIWSPGVPCVRTFCRWFAEDEISAPSSEPPRQKQIDRARLNNNNAPPRVQDTNIICPEHVTKTFNTLMF